MPAQLDLSIVTTIKDPALRASLERLGTIMAEASSVQAPEPPSGAKIIQFPLFPQETRPVSNDMARSALFSCIQGKDRRKVFQSCGSAILYGCLRGIASPVR